MTPKLQGWLVLALTACNLIIALPQAIGVIDKYIIHGRAQQALEQCTPPVPTLPTLYRL